MGAVRERKLRGIAGIVLLVWLLALAPAAVVYGAFVPAQSQELLDHYKYDKNIPLNATAELIEENADLMYRLYRVYYDSLSGERVPADLYIPYIPPLKPDATDVEVKREEIRRKNALAASAPWPVVFFMHFHVSDKSMAAMLVKSSQGFASRGIAVFAIDGVFRGDRQIKDGDIVAKTLDDTAGNMETQIKDILRGFDYLASRDDIDIKRFGYMGISMGAFTGTVACAVDPRVKSVVLADGGANFALFLDTSDYGSARRLKDEIESGKVNADVVRAKFQFVDPLFYAPLLTPRPVLLMNGKQDTTVPVPTIEALHAAVQEPKRIIWFDTDHILPPGRTVRESLTWFQDHL